jgi:formylglycine-generating enzyme required for sulfatase activity
VQQDAPAEGSEGSGESGADAGDASSEDAAGADASDASSEDAAGTDASDGSVADASDGGVTVPSSCAPGGAGMTNCGAGGDGGGSESCCTSLSVTGGTYDRTYTNSGDGGAANLATVSSFRLDKYEVTVGRFRQFAAAYNNNTWTQVVTQGSGKHTHLNGGMGLAAGPNVDAGQTYESGWSTGDNSKVQPTNTVLASCGAASSWTNSAGTRENLPINCVNWYEAYAFCIWDGGFLPSAAEWEYAAAGGNELREYPWGNTAPGTACPGAGCSYAIYGCYYPNGGGACSGLVTNIANVGYATQGAGRWGQLDLAGNVWEWNLDWFDFTYANPCTDCVNLTVMSARVMRGGNFSSDFLHLAPVVQGSDDPRTHDSLFPGVRCARTP